MRSLAPPTLRLISPLMSCTSSPRLLRETVLSLRIACACIVLCGTTFNALAQTLTLDERGAPPQSKQVEHRVRVIVTPGLPIQAHGADIRVVVEGAHLNSIVKALGSDSIKTVVRGVLGSRAFESLGELFASSGDGHSALTAALDGRIILLVGDSWALGVDAGAAGNRALLHSLGAQLASPGVYEIKSQGAQARMRDGWLVIAPHDIASEQVAGALFAMLPMQDAALPPEVGLRIGLRHGAPNRGATAISVTTVDQQLLVAIEGQYKQSPLGDAQASAKLNTAVVGRFGKAACAAIAQPCDGLPSAKQAFWIAVLPELLPPPAMRANLSGEKLYVVGRGCPKGAPSVACCMRIDDFEQGSQDQRAYMMRIESGIVRSLSGGIGVENGVGGGGGGLRPLSRPLLGRFLEQQFGSALKLGSMSLCWRTVPTPCGGWQVYASDAPWLESVCGELESAGCPQTSVELTAGTGFIDGPQACSILRTWKPLASDDDPDGNVGIEALASLLDGLGVVHFRYALPQEGRVSAELRIEPPSAVTAR